MKKGGRSDHIKINYQWMGRTTRDRIRSENCWGMDKRKIISWLLIYMPLAVLLAFNTLGGQAIEVEASDPEPSVFENCEVLFVDSGVPPSLLDGGTGLVVYSGQSAAHEFTLATDITITEIAPYMGRNLGPTPVVNAYITDNIGPETTANSVLATFSFTVDSPFNPNADFQQVSTMLFLPAGTYFLVLSSDDMLGHDSFWLARAPIDIGTSFAASSYDNNPAFPPASNFQALSSFFGHGYGLRITGIPGDLTDTDGDGVPEVCDACPDSDLSPTVVVGDCDSGVPNVVLPDGCTIVDLVAQCENDINGALTHGEFKKCVQDIAHELKQNGVISGSEQDAITHCAATQHKK